MASNLEIISKGIDAEYTTGQVLFNSVLRSCNRYSLVSFIN